jgi:selenocysteine lyase/cysteine desulfurase
VEQAYGQLTAANVVVSQREDLIRISPHCYNTDEEILLVGQTLRNTQTR